MRQMLTRLIALVLLLTVFAVPVIGHELGTAQVFLEFTGDGSVRVEIPVDPDVLLMRLDALAGRPLADPVSVDERNHRLAAAASEFGGNCELVFDGRNGPDVRAVCAACERWFE